MSGGDCSNQQWWPLLLLSFRAQSQLFHPIHPERHAAAILSFCNARSFAARLIEQIESVSYGLPRKGCFMRTLDPTLSQMGERLQGAGEETVQTPMSWHFLELLCQLARSGDESDAKWEKRRSLLVRRL